MKSIIDENGRAQAQTDLEQVTPDTSRHISGYFLKIYVEIGDYLLNQLSYPALKVYLHCERRMQHYHHPSDGAISGRDVAKKLQMNEETARRAFQELCHGGIFVRTWKPGCTATYRRAVPFRRSQTAPCMQTGGSGPEAVAPPVRRPGVPPAPAQGVPAAISTPRGGIEKKLDKSNEETPAAVLSLAERHPLKPIPMDHPPVSAALMENW
jgi:hypothetical protein